ncbi:Glycosyltransferase involved in cell wall bisynthesis [Fontimonas thermophila]|uniref:Glycosyltransferase involved in cell wall bisynthesis n=1 Tax=Fontimonas thermophila TaxID=1076937 RepID=A0A1I2IQA3_9GAMM|nr:glycosyltransferase family 4 protein [Fontimonas thermophila]SFF42701.1 Glycosyltransferase involved in cell wall bisynthesis [Fontimonas thermophila]
MKIALFANTDWYLYNFRRSLALAIRDAGYEPLLLSPPGPYAARLQALGLRWQPVPMDRRSLNPLRELALLWWLRGLLRRERVDLVHGFTIKCAVYGAISARWAGVPARVGAVAGMGYVFTSEDFKARLLRPVVRRLIRWALGGEGARLILQNPDDVTLFRQAGLVDADKIRLIYGSGVDAQRFTPGPEAGNRPAGQALRVLLVARLLWDKGIAEYVEAARMLRRRGLALHFLLAGTPDEGNPAAIPVATVQQWQDEGVIDWLGHVEDMPALYASADIMVLPSYREGLPKTLIEAAACGLPIVTTDAPGCREVVTHEQEGLLVPVRDAQALTEAIARLSSDAALRARLGAAARKKVLERFDERIVIEQTLKVYTELSG